jgi:hypothetical protein
VPLVISSKRQVEAANWDLERADWHANLPFVHTTQAESIHDAMESLVRTNRQPVDEAKPAILLDGRAGYGKSAIIKNYLYDYHRAQARQRPAAPRRGSRLIDVIHISMRSATNERGLAERIRDFLELPPTGRTEREITGRVLDALFECEVKIVAIDELHFLGRSVAAGHRMSNYIKDLLNQSPCTFIFGGNDVLESDIFARNGRLDAAGEQFLSLVNCHTIQPFLIAERNDEWVRTLIAIERNLRITRQEEGDLFWRCADIVWAMSGGRWRSLTRLVNQACARAIELGTEQLSPALFAELPLDALAADNTRKYLSTLGDGTWSSLPPGR